MSRLFVLLAVSVLALSTGACATIVEGTSQDIAVTTMPGGATCEFERVGSVIALIDASSGANNNYPDTISLALPPENFESAEARDSFFDALSAEADRRGETVMAAANTSALCRKDPEGKECVDLIAEIETARERERAQIETQRSEVIIEPMGEGT